MYFTAKLDLEGEVFNILEFTSGIDQCIDTNGYPTLAPTGGVVELKLESAQSTALFAHAVSHCDMRNFKIIFTPVKIGAPSRIIELYDTYCISYREFFNDESAEPLYTRVSFSPGITAWNGEKKIEKWWKRSEVNNNAGPSNAINYNQLIKERQTEEKPSIMECFYTNLEGQNIEQIAPGKVILNITTQNCTGKLVDIDLNNDHYDFYYKGVLAKDDILNDIKVTGESMQLELEAKLTNEA